MAKKPILIYASSPDALAKVKCTCCDKFLVVARQDNFCPICFSKLKGNSLPVMLSATSSSLEPRLKCVECKSYIYSNMKY